MQSVLSKGEFFYTQKYGTCENLSKAIDEYIYEDSKRKKRP
ncbi:MULTISPECIES: IS3 family transposase [Virgibacillus]|nr:IS3 family transposase [Virgibacillus massiliensis]